MAKIPPEWKLSQELLDPSWKDVTGIPERSGILDEIELIITKTDATGILAKVHSGQWTAYQVTIAFCKRAAIAHQLVNCLMEICFDEAIEQARSQDNHFRQTGGNTVGPLHGLPVSIKDHVSVAGLRSTLGYIAWADDIQAEDALYVKSLKQAGAIIFVKTTMPQTGMAIETASNLWGRTTNGFNRDLVAGGSSGGDGALVGLFGAPVGIGTDVAGSIRVPCAFNGLYGIRPTVRRFSYEKIATALRGGRGIPAVIGPMVHSIRDIQLICDVQVAAAHWEEDPNVMRIPWNPRPILPNKLAIGLLTFDGVVMPHPPILRGLKEAAEKLRIAGHEVIEMAPYQQRRAWDLAVSFPRDVCRHHSYQRVQSSLYFATGGQEAKAQIAAGREPWFPAMEKLHCNPTVRERSAKELYDVRSSPRLELAGWSLTIVRRIASGRSGCL